MPKRRSLTDGLKSPPKANPAKEAAFVYGPKSAGPEAVKKVAKPKPQPVVAAPPPPPAADVLTEPQPEQNLGRLPLTTRVRSDIGAALKRASLERQLAGQVPNTVQDILEEALEPWLRSHGYLK
jgi:hypothetical protein